MSSAKPDAFGVTILGKDYRIACEPSEEDALQQAAKLLDARMQEIRGTGKVIGSDRIAVIAALNLAHELLTQASHANHATNTANKRIRTLCERIEVTLNDGTQ